MRKWSPQQMAVKLREDHPDDPHWWVPSESIYKSLYAQGRGGLRAELDIASGSPVRCPEVRGGLRASDGHGAHLGPAGRSERPCQTWPLGRRPVIGDRLTVPGGCSPSAQPVSLCCSRCSTSRSRWPPTCRCTSVTRGIRGTAENTIGLVRANLHKNHDCMGTSAMRITGTIADVRSGSHPSPRSGVGRVPTTAISPALARGRPRWRRCRRRTRDPVARRDRARRPA